MKMIRLTLKYLKSYPALAALIVASVFLLALFEGASFGMLIPLIQGMTQGAPAIFANMGRGGGVSAIFVLLFALLLLKNAFLYLTEVMIAKLRFSVTRDLRASLMENILEYDTAFFDSAKSGDIITVINTETERMGDFFKSVLQFTALSGRVAA